MTFKEKFDRILPRYTRAPLAVALTLNMVVYFLLRLFVRDRFHYDLTLSLDGRVPLVPSFVVVYVLAYVQWAVGYVVIARESPALCYRILSGEVISKLICAVFFVAFPTTMTRPEITGGDIFSKALGLIYFLDTPDNLFPSIHCLESWLCFRGSLEVKKLGVWYRWAGGIFTLLVFASTLFVKQHVLLDILGGVAVAEAGQLISRVLHADRLFEKLNTRLMGETV